VAAMISPRPALWRASEISGALVSMESPDVTVCAFCMAFEVCRSN
jgi:hypothetical protein